MFKFLLRRNSGLILLLCALFLIGFCQGCSHFEKPMPDIAAPTKPPLPQPAPPPVSRQPPGTVPLVLNGKAIAIETYEHSEISGDWILFYEGTVTQIGAHAVTLRLEKRYGYRFSPNHEGVDSTNWWCVPKRRHCYSQVSFSDWHGLYRPRQEIAFPKGQVFSSAMGIVNGVHQFIREKP